MTILPEPSESELSAIFLLLEKCVAANERCPKLDGRIMRALVRAKKIRIEDYRTGAHGKYWRVALLLVGPYAGRTTTLPPFQAARPSITMTADGIFTRH